MPPPRTETRKGLPLRVLLPLLVAVPMLLTAAAMGYVYQRSLSAQVFSAQGRLLTQAGLRVAERLDNDSRQTRAALRTLVESALPRLHRPEQRRTLLPLLLGVLRNSPTVQSVYFGYADGDLMVVRRVDDAFRRQYPSTPAEARWASLLGSNQNTRLLFLDSAGHELPSPPVYAPYHDPRTRPWYRMAMASDGPIVTPLYRFAASGRTGFSYARRDPASHSVAGIDVNLDSVQKLLQQLNPLPGALLGILDSRHRQLVDNQESGPPTVWQALQDAWPQGGKPPRTLDSAGHDWHVTTLQLRSAQRGQPYYLALLVPEEELFAEGQAILRRSAWIPVAILLLVLPLGWALSQLVSRPLRRLTAQAQAMRALDFSPTPQPYGPVREINRLQDATEGMKLALHDFIGLSRQIVAESPLAHPLETVLDAAMRALPASRGGLWLVDGDALRPCRSAAHEGTPPRLGAFPHYDRLLHDVVGPCCVSPQQAPAGVLELHRPGDILTVLPLRLENGALLGLLVLAAPQGQDASGHRSRFLGALADFAAVAVDNRRLAGSLQELMNALVKLVADAIDAKSAHTGGHCQRVPLIAQLLAEAAHRAETGPFAGFQLDDNRREALYIASWLHDCGKLTTPDHVIDKGSKLEAPYDRIHEIRMRFEVLKRDAHVAYWQGVAQGGDEAALAAERERLLQTLDEEFAFVARCNNGDEPVQEHDRARLQAIAARRWLRTLDDRLGLGPMEAQRLAAIPPTPAPAYEALLADKPEHRIPRPEHEKLGRDNRWGFRLDEPELLYHRGELHNLSIRHGTLTAEERYKVNAHIVETIKMLETLPFPPHLAEVPEIAGGHHERMDGHGYPRAIPGAQMSVLARVMAVADIFEALTAADRPYKPPKKLSEALAIMQKMTAGGHLDPELYRLFLLSRVWQHYAERCLQPEQLDVDDPTPYLPAP